MRKVLLAAVVPLVLSCSQARGPGIPGESRGEGDDPSRDRYLAETFLDIASTGSDIEAGVASELDLPGSEERREAWLRVGTEGLSGSGRIRLTGESFHEAFYIGASPAGGFRIDLGDILPDLGIGLVSSGRRFTYPFSSRHPLYRPRGMRGWTGFYGSFIRGGSIRASAGPLKVTMLHGRPAVHGGEAVEYSVGRGVSGLRLEAGAERILGGLTVMEAGSREGGGIAGLDLTFSSKGRRYMFETAATSSRSFSAAWGLTIDGENIDCGIIGWSVPAGSEGFLASFPGLSTAAGRLRSGASIVLRGKLPRRTYLSAWAEARRSSNGYEREITSALRLEAGIRWKRSSARFIWSSRVQDSEDLVPYPPGEEVERESTRGMALSLSYRPSALIAMVLELKRPHADSGEGLLCASRVSLAIRSLRSRLSVSAASYRARAGNPRFALYEPSGAGRYPWKSLFGSGKRLAVGIDTKISVFRASVSLLWTGDGVKEAGMRLSAGI